MSTYGMSALATSEFGSDRDPDCAALEPQHLVEGSERDQQGAEQGAERNCVVGKSHRSLHRISELPIDPTTR